jgi:phage FluMu gp28-like protein
MDQTQLRDWLMKQVPQDTTPASSDKTGIGGNLNGEVVKPGA